MKTVFTVAEIEMVVGIVGAVADEIMEGRELSPQAKALIYKCQSITTTHETMLYTEPFTIIKGR